ncbi:hypothetical protein B0O99DRAFT_688245 [Bisporella sp. PMI_857]|nr:hypothetical protein B0O99DRAFT_688245 [Bisporella sp. PMI_857]
MSNNEVYGASQREGCYGESCDDRTASVGSTSSENAPITRPPGAGSDILSWMKNLTEEGNIPSLKTKLSRAQKQLLESEKVCNDLRIQLRRLRVEARPSRIEDVSSDDDDDHWPTKVKHAEDDRLRAEVDCENAKHKVQELERRLESRIRANTWLRRTEQDLKYDLNRIQNKLSSTKDELQDAKSQRNDALAQRHTLQLEYNILQATVDRHAADISKLNESNATLRSTALKTGKHKFLHDAHIKAQETTIEDLRRRLITSHLDFANLKEDMRLRDEEQEAGILYQGLVDDLNSARESETQTLEDLAKARQYIGEQDLIVKRFEFGMSEAERNMAQLTEGLKETRDNKDGMRSQLERTLISKAYEPPGTKNDAAVNHALQLQNVLNDCLEHKRELLKALEELATDATKWDGANGDLCEGNDGVEHTAREQNPIGWRKWMRSISTNLQASQILVNRLIRTRNNLRRELISYSGRVVEPRGEMEREEYNPEHGREAGYYQDQYEKVGWPPRLHWDPSVSADSGDWPVKEWSYEYQVGQPRVNIAGMIGDLEGQINNLRNLYENQHDNLINWIKRATNAEQLVVRGMEVEREPSQLRERCRKQQNNLMRQVLRNSGQQINYRGEVTGENRFQSGGSQALMDYEHYNFTRLDNTSGTPMQLHTTRHRQRLASKSRGERLRTTSLGRRIGPPRNREERLGTTSLEERNGRRSLGERLGTRSSDSRGHPNSQQDYTYDLYNASPERSRDQSVQRAHFYQHIKSPRLKRRRDAGSEDEETDTSERAREIPKTTQIEGEEHIQRSSSPLARDPRSSPNFPDVQEPNSATSYGNYSFSSRLDVVAFRSPTYESNENFVVPSPFMQGSSNQLNRPVTITQVPSDIQDNPLNIAQSTPGLQRQTNTTIETHASSQNQHCTTTQAAPRNQPTLLGNQQSTRTQAPPCNNLRSSTHHFSESTNTGDSNSSMMQGFIQPERYFRNGRRNRFDPSGPTNWDDDAAV